MIVMSSKVARVGSKFEAMSPKAARMSLEIARDSGAATDNLELLTKATRFER